MLQSDNFLTSQTGQAACFLNSASSEVPKPRPKRGSGDKTEVKLFRLESILAKKEKKKKTGLSLGFVVSVVFTRLTLGLHFGPPKCRTGQFFFRVTIEKATNTFRGQENKWVNQVPVVIEVSIESTLGRSSVA